MTYIDAPSPNFDERGRAVDMVILHYTGMPTGAEALERLRDPAAKVSAHYLVEEDGRVFHLVAEEKRAWHAGVSSWKGEAEINARSMGVEIVNPGHEWGYGDFPLVQISALVRLLKDIRSRHSRSNPHKAFSVIRTSRRRARKIRVKDFPWALLAAEGLCIGAL